MVNDSGTAVRASMDVEIEPSDAFSRFVDDLALALSGEGIEFESGPDGRVVEGGFEVGRVEAWIPGERILLTWRPAKWNEDAVTEIELRFDKIDGGTRLRMEHRRWGRQIDDAGELTGWFADQVVAPLLRAASPSAFGDWLTDRGARRPSGARARSIYGDPLYHYPNFEVILQELSPGPEDYLLEVGCGGGALLKRALRSGCRAAAVDHSPDMVRLTRDVNREALEEGRLEVRHATAERLPFDDDTFTCAAMTGVLGFLPDPVAALGEIRRVLARGGRLVVLGSDPELKGTAAAPEPMASRLTFYTEQELERLARSAGFDEVNVVRRDLEPFARSAGVPEEHLPLFAGPGATFLIANKT